MMAEENIYAELLDALHEGVICFDPEWSILSVNQSARSLFRAAEGEVVGKSLLPFLCGEKRESVTLVSGFVKSVLGQESVKPSLEVVLSRSDGSSFPADISVSRVALGSSWIGALVVRDASPEKRHELALTKALAELEDSNRKLRVLNHERNEFIGIAAHDLRTPLHRVTLALDLIEDPAVPEEKKGRFFQMIRTASQGMKRLIDDLLSMSKLSSGTLELKRKLVKVEDFVHEVLDFQSELARQRGIVLASELLCEERTASLDLERMHQVVNNLLSNAFKYTPEGSSVTLSVTSTKEKFSVSVKDSGVGIPREEQSKLFEPFARLSPKPIRGEASTGLGLAICKEIVELHGGSMGFESQQGKGSHFWFEIPRA